jgi:phospholipid-binding lipoprotein MlaA
MRLQLTKLLLSCFLAIIATGCATLENNDPLESVNRGVYKFNDAIDGAILKPVAGAYKTVIPSLIRKGVNNFFNNLKSLTTVLNDILQLKFSHAFKDAGRFVINSTFGLAGVIDVASMGGIPVHREDFGQTLGHWGVGSGAYIVLPFLGPSSVRDAAGFGFDTVTSDPITYAHNIGQVRLHNQLRVASLIDKRTQLLNVSDILDSASLDHYAFMRDAYLQSRASQVQDGLVPDNLLEDIFEPAVEDIGIPAS